MSWYVLFRVPVQPFVRDNHPFFTFDYVFVLYISFSIFLYFNMKQISKDNPNLSHLSKDSEISNKQTNLKLVESLMIAQTVLQLADSYRKKQYDTNLKSMGEVMKQTELTRTLIVKIKTDSPNESFPKNISYSEAVKLSPIVLKPTPNQTFS